MEFIEDSSKNKCICNNCGISGHLFYHCRKPITSFGIISFRINYNTNKLEYLMVQRKDSLGYVDFIRGKYNENSDFHIRNLINEMTNIEKKNIINSSYSELWDKLWNKTTNKYDSRNEEKFNYVKKHKLGLILNSKSNWENPEWGFPKGRRNYREKDLDAGIREWEEESGYSRRDLKLIKNINTFEEIFTGSNFKSYKHRYYLGYIDYKKSYNETNFQKSEIGDLKWFTYEDCLTNIRNYNIEKIMILININKIILNHIIW